MKLQTKPTGADRLTIAELEDLFTKVSRDDNGCWNWTASTSSHGYGEYWNRPRGFEHVLVHRLTLELVHGSIIGSIIDHLCENTICCNPRHLSIGTQADNVLRGASPQAKNARATHCKRGHEFTPDNIYTRPSQNWRECIKCRSFYA